METNAHAHKGQSHSPNVWDKPDATSLHGLSSGAKKFPPFKLHLPLKFGKIREREFIIGGAYVLL